MVPEQPVAVRVPVQGTIFVPMSVSVTVLMAPVVAALVGGIAGLFLMRMASEVDGRLTITGMSVRAVLLGRATVLGIGALVASVMAPAVMSFTYVPERLGWFLIAMVITGLCYGAIGAVIGLAFNRLAGIYIIMFGPLLDLFLVQSPLTSEAPDVAPYLPGHYPVKLAFDAAFTPSVTYANIWGAIAYLAAVGVVAGLAFSRSLRVI